MRKNRWWNEDVANCRKIVRTSYRTWVTTGSHSDREAYVRARQELKHTIREAKIQSWQHFCSAAGSPEEGSPKELAKINKILYRQVNQTLGMLRLRDGTQASSPEESIDVLLDEHFPESTSPTISLRPETAYGRKAVGPPLGWLSVDRIRRAIAKFSPYKTAGADDVKPVALQHLPPISLERLGILYQASLELQCVPTTWRTSKVIFIPKVGKDDYSQPRSWRPISLMSFLFKTLERLILWHLEETVLKESNFHKNQHAFRKGRSTESALSDTIDILESEVLRKGVAIGVFLDIEGAFDNLLPEGVIRSLRSRNTPEPLLKWFRNYLYSRMVLVDYKGVHTTRKLVKGTPQGGVLSPVLWNLAFDEVLSLVEGTAVRACGYADDLVLIGRGPDPITNIACMQQVLDKVSAWGTGQGLRFSAAKSVAVAFTRKTKWSGPDLTLNNSRLEWKKEVKYLGVLLHHRLHWADHVMAVTKKAKWLLFKYKTIVGLNFGPHPRFMRWMFTGIVQTSTYIWSYSLVEGLAGPRQTLQIHIH